MKSEIYKAYCNILKKELVLAMGCTEPIAIAYASSIAVRALGKVPEKITARLSGNIIKNVKSVVVPGTCGERGIKVALAAGILSAAPEKGLEVLANLKSEDSEKIRSLTETCDITIEPLYTGHVLDIDLLFYAGNDFSEVRIVDTHTNVALVKKNERAIIEKPIENGTDVEDADYDLLDIDNIVTFADEVALSDVSPLIERQLNANIALSNEGMAHNYGANIGKILLSSNPNDLHTKARAMAAAASDARMNGSELAAGIVSGSGNQGITASIPVWVYSEALSSTKEMLYRALVVSNLVTIHQKAGIGRLSAYCGAVSAGCGCGAGIAYLNGGKQKEVAHTLVNSIAILSGMVCDGAKASCAAKIAMAVDAGILGFEMYRQGQQFYGGDGIVTKGVENTISNVCDLAKNGMHQTDEEIMRIMTKN